MRKSIAIANRLIGLDHPPLIVAEISGNHHQDFDRAIRIVEAAAKAGAHAIKLQTYTAETMTFNLTEGLFFIADEKSLWKGKSLYQLYEEAYTPWEWHAPIMARCKELGMLCFSTPFDSTAVDFLETLHVPCYKIASFENTDLPLIRKVAATGKPLMISTGMASVAELDETVRTAREAGCTDLILLKCTSSYPASPDSTHIRTISHLRDLFQCEVGLSDHTMGIGVAIASIALGATIIEKHFTLRRAQGGVDAAFSLEPEELQSLVIETERAWRSLGNIHYHMTSDEKKSMQFKRSLYIASDMQAGEAFTPQNLRAIRPGGGLPPKYYDVILGRKTKSPIKRGTPLSWDLIA